MFPGIKWAKVKQINDDGSIETQEPRTVLTAHLIILPALAAEKIIAQVSSLQGPYNAEKASIEAKYKGMVAQMAPFAQ